MYCYLIPHESNHGSIITYNIPPSYCISIPHGFHGNTSPLLEDPDPAPQHQPAIQATGKKKMKLFSQLAK